MTEYEFWRVIANTKAASKGSSEAQAELMVEYLSQMSEGDILDFDTFYKECIQRAYDRNLWDAIVLFEGVCSHEGFFDFRAWLVGQGHHIYETIIREPDTLADFVEIGQRTQVEDFSYVSSRAYEIKTGGQEMPIQKLSKTKLKNDGAATKDLPIRYPKLYEKFVLNKKAKE